MVKHLAQAISFILGAAVAAHAQGPRTPAAPPAQVDMMDLQTAMIKAQAASIRPGDEALGCDALQKELISAMSDPSIQTYATKTNAALAKDLETREKSERALTPEAAAALSASLAPGLAMASLAQAGAGASSQPATPEQMRQAMVAQMKQLVTIMPMLMRSQRVTELAIMKNCTWATGIR
jgi:hypothetical protein